MGNKQNKVIDEQTAKVKLLQDEMRGLQFDINVSQRKLDRLQKEGKTEEAAVVMNKIKLMEEKLERTRARVDHTEGNIETIEKTQELKEDNEDAELTKKALFEIHRNKYGRAYKVKNGEIEDWVKRKRISLFSGFKTVEKEYGVGIRIYFEFGLFLFVVNLFIGFLHLIPVFVEFFYIDHYTQIFEALFTSQFSPEVLWTWRVINIITLLVILLVPVAYYIIFSLRDSKFGDYGFKEEVCDKIPENQNIKMCTVICLRILSFSIYFFLLFVEVILISIFTVLQNVSYVKNVWAEENLEFLSVGAKYANLAINLGYSVLISVSLSLVNTIFQKICLGLTRMEKYKYYTHFTISFTAKLISFKILNLFVMSTVKGFLVQNCILSVIGQQYIVQIIVDIFFKNAVEILVPVVKQEITLWKMGEFKTTLKNRVAFYFKQEEFDVAIEYLEYIYRQFIVYISLPSLSFIAIFAAFSSFLEIYLDKMKLILFSQRPPRTSGRMKVLITSLLVGIAVLSMLSWGGGSIYQISGLYWCNTLSYYNSTLNGRFSQCDLCPIFGGGEIQYNLLGPLFGM